MADLRVGLLGDGYINGALRRQVEESRPYRVVGSYGRRDELPGPGVMDVIVEAATQRAVRERVPGLLDAGVDVILLSIGALAEPDLRARVSGQTRGRLIACTGAIGGLDQVRALRAGGPLSAASIESRKLPATLIQPWMSDGLQAQLREGRTEVVLADGLAAEVAQRFPASANVAAALALAADAWDFATARVVADPTAHQTRHEIRAAGELGEMRAVVTNAPSTERPRSSAVVAWAVLRALDDYARLRGFPAPDGAAYL